MDCTLVIKKNDRKTYKMYKFVSKTRTQNDVEEFHSV